MTDTQIQLAFIWVALMLTYFLGDVMRIFSGDFEKMKGGLKGANQWMWLGISVVMLIPILMILFTLFLPYNINRPANIIAAGFFFLFNLVGLPTYPSWYDRFLIVVGLVFNVITIAVAWNWVM